MSAFAEACSTPFSNGTEGDAWQYAWCRHCARDHEMHDDTGPGCGLLCTAFIGEWPEGWIPEPDDGHFHLPSRMVCMAFTPCTPCGGDPGEHDRAERVSEVTAYWKDRR